jgi:long-subunit fatty acid transport protein
MKRYAPYLLSLLLLALCAGAQAQIGGTAGSFSRLGFGARGIGMGNASVAVATGMVGTYYNPALGAFASERTVSATFGILSFDRSLNFVSYNQPLKPMAGLSVGLINAGVRNIDGRDGDGQHTEDYSVTENQFYLSFSNRVDERVSLGVTVKLLYAKLFESVKSTTVGFDAGICARLTDELTLGAAVIDLNSKYKWDTKQIYSENGRATEDKFPNLRRIGLSYALPGASALVSAEFENSSEGTSLFRLGAEYAVTPQFTVRGGVDRIELGDHATGAKPSLGFSVMQPLDGWTPALHYTYVVESYAPHGMHIITLSSAL